MNSKIKILLIGLAILCAVSLVIAFQLNGVNKALRSEFSMKEQQFEQEKQVLNKQVASLLETKKKLDVDLGELRARVEALTKDRDGLKGKFDLVSKERASLVEKVQSLAHQKKELEDETAKLKKSGATVEGAVSAMPGATTDDVYWANVLREKASLEILLKNLNTQFSDAQLKTSQAMDEGRKIDLQLKSANAAKEDLMRRLVYNEKLAETLSEDLVREKRDKKAIGDQFESLRQENFELKSRLMALGDKKTSLESRLVDVQQEREVLAKRLGELDQILQERVDQIIAVKDDLKAARTQSREVSIQDSRVVQLQPIVVKADEEKGPAAKASRTAGQVLAINEENNFIIVDMGEGDGIKVGQSLTVYRNSQKIAALEVIQTRKEISAADIKNVTPGAKIKIGDMVS